MLCVSLRINQEVMTKQQISLRNKVMNTRNKCTGEVLFREGNIYKKFLFKKGVQDIRFADYLVVEHVDGNVLSLTKLR
jgi:hypothetical protein